MDGSIRLSANERNALLQAYRAAPAARSRRAHIVLLLDDGLTYREVRQVTYASFDLIREAACCYRSGGVDSVVGPIRPAAETPALWLLRVAHWLLTTTPEDFGYFRCRWSCETLAEVLAWETGSRRSAETVRRGLRRLGFVWRRPRPVVGPVDPEYAEKLQGIRDLLTSMTDDETAVFQDEVDIHLNPKIGACWMPRGEQAEVPTPGNNDKRHLAGSLVWRTGTLIVSPAGRRRNSELFVAHLDDLRCRLRAYRRIHVICDNAAFHRSRLVQEYLVRWGHRIELHYLPKYAPETNPIERVWWQLHETLTRNHRCSTIDELLEDVYEWINTDRCFYNQELADYPMAA
jgi:putative transposase